MLLCCLRRNVEASCHKHFVVVSREKTNSAAYQRPTSVINLPWSVAAVCIALGGRTVHSTRWIQILAENRDFCPTPLAFDAHVRAVPVYRMVPFPLTFNEPLLRFSRSRYTERQLTRKWCKIEL